MPIQIAVLLLVFAAGDDMEIDRSWIPRPGDKATIHDEKGLASYGAVDMFAFGEVVKFDRAGDATGLKELILRRRMTTLKSGTEVLVIERHVNSLIANGVHALEVRVLDGEQKDVKLWVYESDVSHFVPRPLSAKVFPGAPVVATYPPPKKFPTAAERATTLLAMGRNLEKSGKPKPALEYYRKVVADYKDTPAAKDAAARIKALAP